MTSAGPPRSPYQALLAAADRGDAPAVVLLHGASPVLAEDAVARVCRGLLGPGDDSALAREVVDVREAGAEPAVRAAATMPLLGGRRVVVARGVEALTARPSASLLAYIAAPNLATALILVAERELEPGHWLVKAMPSAAVVAVALPVGRGLVSWLCARARSLDRELADDAASLLIELVGEDAGALGMELEKAALAGGPDHRRITVADVEAVVGVRRARSVFELVRALEARDRGRSLAVLQALLDTGEEPLAVLGMLVREARAACQVREWRRRGRSPDEIARALRRPPRAVAALLARVDAMGATEAQQGLVRCWQAERRLKLGANPRAELSLLVADLCRA